MTMLSRLLSTVFLLSSIAQAFVRNHELAATVTRLRRSVLSKSSNSDEVALFRRKPPPPNGYGAVLLASERLLMPGATRSFHFYDQNLLGSLEHAMTQNVGSPVLALVGYDPESRKLNIGSSVLVAVVGVENSKRVNSRRQEISESKIVSVEALRPCRVNRITQYEPFVVADTEDLDLLDSPAPSIEQDASIQQLCSEVMKLRDELGLALLPATADGRLDDTAADPAASQHAAGSLLAEVRAHPEASRILRTLTAAQHCKPETRAGALYLNGEALGDYVLAELADMRATLVAMKSIRDLA